MAPGHCRRDKNKPLNPSEKDLNCVVHDREWKWHDILLVDGLESGCTVSNVKERISKIKDIPGASMEVVIFEVGEVDRGGTAGGSSKGSSSGGSRRGEWEEEGPISVCLWAPVKPGKEKRYLVTVAAYPT